MKTPETKSPKLKSPSSYWAAFKICSPRAHGTVVKKAAEFYADAQKAEASDDMERALKFYSIARVVYEKLQETWQDAGVDWTGDTYQRLKACEEKIKACEEKIKASSADEYYSVAKAAEVSKLPCSREKALSNYGMASLRYSALQERDAGSTTRLRECEQKIKALKADLSQKYIPEFLTVANKYYADVKAVEVSASIVQALSNYDKARSKFNELEEMGADCSAQLNECEQKIQTLAATLVKVPEPESIPEIKLHRSQPSAELISTRGNGIAPISFTPMVLNTPTKKIARKASQESVPITKAAEGNPQPQPSSTSNPEKKVARTWLLSRKRGDHQKKGAPQSESTETLTMQHIKKHSAYVVLSRRSKADTLLKKCLVGTYMLMPPESHQATYAYLYISVGNGRRPKHFKLEVGEEPGSLLVKKGKHDSKQYSSLEDCIDGLVGDTSAVMALPYSKEDVDLKASTSSLS